MNRNLLPPSLVLIGLFVAVFFAKRYIFETVLAREAVREKMHDSANILIKDDKVFELTD